MKEFGIKGLNREGLKWLGYLLLWICFPIYSLHAQSEATDTIISGLYCAPVQLPPDSAIVSGPYHPRFFPASRYAPRQLIPPGILMATGITMDLSQGLKNTQMSFYEAHLAGFHTALDNTLLYLPVAIPYGLDLLGVKSKTDIANRTAILVKGEILVTATGYLLKHTIPEWRPDGSNHYSFPSGHTLQVFAMATMLSEEYRDRYKWMPYAAYGLATGVGLLRLANNKHYLGDVLVGAGLGILAMKLVYWTHHYRWDKHRIFK